MIYGYYATNDNGTIVGFARTKRDYVDNLAFWPTDEYKLIKPEAIYDAKDTDMTKLRKLLKKGKCPYSWDFQEDNGKIIVEIENDTCTHSYCDMFVESLRYTLEDEITDEEGFDFYKSIHVYVKAK